jgi:hypothetical protein
MRRAVSDAPSQSGAKPTVPCAIHFEGQPAKQWVRAFGVDHGGPSAGGSIPKHKHLGQDEILLIQTGTVDVWLGDEERDLWNSRYARTFNRIDKFFGVMLNGCC